MAADRTDTRVFPLALASEGDHLRIASIGAGKELSRKLRDLGLPVGSEVTVIHCPFEGPMVLAHNDTRVALGTGMAHRILVAPVGGRPTLTMKLGELEVGERGRVVALAKGERAYREKLLAMGLTPGTEFTVVRLAPLGDSVEITVRGFSMTLRKSEAEMLSVERAQG